MEERKDQEKDDRTAPRHDPARFGIRPEALLSIRGSEETVEALLHDVSLHGLRLGVDASRSDRFTKGIGVTVRIREPRILVHGICIHRQDEGRGLVGVFIDHPSDQNALAEFLSLPEP